MGLRDLTNNGGEDDSQKLYSPQTSPPAASTAGLSSGQISPDPEKQDDWENTSGILPVAQLHPAVLVSTVFINLLALGLPLVVLQVYDRIIPNQAIDTFTLLLIGLTVVLLFDGIMRIARAYLVGWAGVCYENEVAVEAVERILYAPSHLIEKTPPGIHVDRLNAIDALRDFYGGQSRLLLIDLPFVLVFLGLVAFIGGWIVAVPLLMFAILAAVTLASGTRLREVLEQRAEQDDRRHDFIIETLNGIQTIKTMAMEPQIQRRFEKLQKAGVEASYKTIILGGLAQNIGNLFSSLTMISVVSVGAYLIINGSLSVGTLAACTLLSGRSVQPVLRGLGLWTQLQGLSIAKARLQALYDMPAVVSRNRTDDSNTCWLGWERLADMKSSNHQDDTTIHPGDIKLRNVTYSYDNNTEPAIKDISLDITPGTMVGLQGGAESGKSTLIRLIVGELTPVSGSLTIDGCEASGPERGKISGIIAYVPHKSEIFTGTILQNITMFKTGEAIDAARTAAQLLGLEADVHRLPKGYDTPLSEGISDELPMGMMQRIMIARSLSRRPRILLFDEANTSLDARADKMLREAFLKLKGKVTIVLVSHRPSLLRICDHIYELEKGKIISASAGGVSDNAPEDRTHKEGVAS